jgi:hypothetical protein
MQHLQRRQLPPLSQACLRVRWKPVLENPYRLQGLPVLRLGQRGWLPLHMPRVHRLRVLTRSALLPAVGLVALGGALALGFEGTGWIFGLLVLSAALTAIAQQTLP